MNCKINRTTNNMADVYGPEFNFTNEEIVNNIKKTYQIQTIDPGFNPFDVEVTLLNNDYCNKQGYSYDRYDDYETNAESYAKKVESGDVFAMYKLGTLYEKGQGVSRDYEKAAELYKMVSAIEEEFDYGDPEDFYFYPECEAEYALGCLYENELLANSTMEKAVDWYLRASGNGKLDADFKLAECFLKGQGVPQDYNKAAYHLWHAHRFCGYGVEVRSFIIAKELDAKMKHLQKDVCEILAECYSNGIGTEKDKEKAVEYHEKAIALQLQEKLAFQQRYEKVLMKFKENTQI